MEKNYLATYSMPCSYNFFFQLAFFKRAHITAVEEQIPLKLWKETIETSIFFVVLLRLSNVSLCTW